MRKLAIVTALILSIMGLSLITPSSSDAFLGRCPLFQGSGGSCGTCSWDYNVTTYSRGYGSGYGYGGYGSGTAVFGGYYGGRRGGGWGVGAAFGPFGGGFGF